MRIRWLGNRDLGNLRGKGPKKEATVSIHHPLKCDPFLPRPGRFLFGGNGMVLLCHAECWEGL